MRRSRCFCSVWLFRISLAVCGGWLAAAALLAQEPAASEEKAAPARDFQVRVIACKHAPAELVLHTVRQVCQAPHVTLAANVPGNALIVKAPVAAIDEVVKLVEVLDAEPRAAVDGLQPGRPLRMRLVWLVAGLADDAAAAPPQDLEGALAELAEIGISNLAMSAQFMLPVTEGQKFRVSGTAKVDEPCMLQIEGLVGARPGDDLPAGPPGDATWVRVEVAAVSGGGEPRPLCQLQTTVKAEWGRFVVLGVAPVQSRASVLLLQLLPQPTTSQ